MRSLTGVRILLTRSQRGCDEWAVRVRARGGAPVSFPCIRNVPLPATDDIPARLRRSVNEADWLALTSPFGAEIAARLLGGALPPRLAVAAVGPATAAVVNTRGVPRASTRINT